MITTLPDQYVTSNIQHFEGSRGVAATAIVFVNGPQTSLAVLDDGVSVATIMLGLQVCL